MLHVVQCNKSISDVNHSLDCRSRTQNIREQPVRQNKFHAWFLCTACHNHHLLLQQNTAAAAATATTTMCSSAVTYEAGLGAAGFFAPPLPPDFFHGFSFHRYTPTGVVD